MSNFTYQTINIPQPPGNNVYIAVTGVDAAGDAVGYYGFVDGDGDQNFQGFEDTGGVFSSFNPPTSSNNLGIGITESGEIFGTYVDNRNAQHGFAYSNGTFTNVDVFLASSTWVIGVTASGAIYGSNVSFGQFSGFIDDNGQFSIVNVPSY